MIKYIHLKILIRIKNKLMCTVYIHYIEFYVQHIWLYIYMSVYTKHNFHRAVCDCTVIYHKTKKDVIQW